MNVRLAGAAVLATAAALPALARAAKPATEAPASGAHR